MGERKSMSSINNCPDFMLHTQHGMRLFFSVLFIREQDREKEVSLLMGQLYDPDDYERHKLRRQIFIILFLLIIIGAVGWVLSITNVIGNPPWSTIFSALFTVLGVVAAVLQFLPRPDSSRNRSAIEGIPVRVNKGKSYLVIFGKREQCGETVYLSRGFENRNVTPIQASVFIGRKKGKRKVYVSTFEVDPGNYMVYTDSQALMTKVTLIPQRVTEIDWTLRRQQQH
jgi:hypothetical protein